LEVVRHHAADVVIFKVQPLGGIRACLELATQIDLPVVVSSAVETSVGLAMGLALAAALPDLPFACGLGTGQLLTADATSRPLRPVGGVIPVDGIGAAPASETPLGGDGPGPASREVSGAAPGERVPAGRVIPDRLDAIAADAATHARWLGRLRDVAELTGVGAGQAGG
jgi:hypothetical protein